MEIVIRVAATYAVVLIGLRLVGKREFGELSALEVVTLLLIPEIVSQSLVREASFTNAMIGAATVLSIVYLTSLLKHLWPRAGRLIEGQPCVLVRDGQIMADLMNRERIDPDELLDAMRSEGIEAFGQIKWAILETDGSISIIQKQPEK